MDKSRTALELKFSLEFNGAVNKEGISCIKNPNQIKEKSKNLANLEEAVKRSIFWKMHLKRKSGLEEIDHSIENLVKECKFWKQQLEGLTYQNRLLEREKRSLRSDYEALLEKTRHDMGIILNLKDSKKKLAHDTAEYFKSDRELTTMKFVNTDLRSDKLLLENKKNELLNSLKKNTANMERINKIHNRIQSHIAKEKERGERNTERYKEELGKLRKSLTTNGDVFEKFKQNLADHKQPIVELETFLDIGLMKYFGFDLKEDDGKELAKKSAENTSKPETTAAENETPKASKPVSDELTPAEKNILDEWRRNKINSQLAENENSHLLKHYEHLYNRMKDLNERYMEMTDRRHLKETELHRYLVKATDLYQVVMQKRKKFTIPPADGRDELRMRIRTQMNETEALRKLLSLCFSYTNEDLQLHTEFTDEMKEFYTKLLHQEEIETHSEFGTEDHKIPNTQ